MNRAGAGYPAAMADDVKLDLVELAKAAERVASWARACQADLDMGREPRLGLVRQYAAALRAELDRLGR